MEILYFAIPIATLAGFYFMFAYGMPRKRFDTMPVATVKFSVFNVAAMLTMGCVYLALNQRILNNFEMDFGQLIETFTRYVDFLVTTAGGGRYSTYGSSAGPFAQLVTFTLIPAIYIVGVIRAFKMKKYVDEENEEYPDTPPIKYRWLPHAVIYPTTLVFLPAVLIGVVVPLMMMGIGFVILLVMLGGVGMLLKGTRIGIVRR